MINPQYRSSKSRITKQRENQDRINIQILEYIKSVNEAKDAETLWFGMRGQGSNMSISSFNTRLKKLVEAGLVEKISQRYNKHFYRITPKA
ncbi:hypothetical protein [Mucilaginibacter inviolabilis]|uniref:hypothetical protein n=1 Tax=Mucilaginibacter inviolabilis TaxID=2714892 RepID=UPI00140AAE1A|nr:hypothetical protein [Mucilaginibacter inviolabilis]